jgi:plasmid stabilization system protein ParE
MTTPKYEIVWAVIAENDVKNIIETIADDSISEALRIFGNLKQKASGLYNFPERGHIVPELQDHGILQYRELIVPPWRILYRIAGKQMYVLSILDSRQNIEDILLNRLIRSKI